MKPVIVDASVAAKWFLPEAQSEAAARLLDGRRTLLAPDLLPVEFGNVLWKIFRREMLSEQDVRDIIRQFQSLPVEICPTQQLVSQALELAIVSGKTVYDCLYLTLAIQRQGVLVTADERFAGVFKPGPFGGHIRLLSK